MRKCALLFALLPSTALAGIGKIDEVTGSVDEVIISDIVTTELFADTKGGPMPYVSVRVNGDAEKRVQFAISSRTDVITITDAVAEEYGLEVKTANKKLINLKGKDNRYKRVGGEIKYVEIDSLQIGGLELQGVTAMVSSSKGSIGDKPLAIQLGMGAIPEVAYAILPSEGVVRFAPAARAGELTASLGEDVSRSPFEVTQWEVVKFGTRSTGMKLPRNVANKKLRPFRTAQVPATIGGVPTTMAIAYESENSVVSPEVEFTPAARRAEADMRYLWGDVALAGVPLGSAWMYVNASLERGSYRHNGLIGADLLAGVDLVVDPANKQITLRPAAAQKRADPRPGALSQAIKDAEEAEKPPEGASAEEAPSEAELKEGAAGKWGVVADIQMSLGRYEEGLATWKKVTEYAPDSCTNWMSYGEALMMAGNGAEAITSYQRASEQFHAWWDRSLAERQEIEKEMEDMSEEEKKAAGYLPQPGSCHEADGYLAAAYLTRGALGRVEEIYREKLNFSPILAQALGNAALLQGNLALAQEAYRQAIVLESKQTADTRLGLAVTYSTAGDKETAQTLFRKALELDPQNTMAALLWADTLSQDTSPQAAQRQVQAFLDGHPDSVAGYVALARVMRAAGDQGSLAQLGRQGDSFFKREMAARAYDGELAASYALFLVESGRLDEGRQAADDALKMAPNAPLAWIALGNVYVLQGDPQKGLEMFQRAGQIAPLSPGVALLLDAKLPAPAIQ